MTSFTTLKTIQRCHLSAKEGMPSVAVVAVEEEEEAEEEARREEEEELREGKMSRIEVTLQRLKSDANGAAKN